MVHTLYCFCKNVLIDTICAIWYHLYNLKHVKKSHGGVFCLVLSTLPLSPSKVFCPQPYEP